MTEDTSTSYRVSGQKPLDSKTISPSLNVLKAEISSNPSIYYSFYKGMKIYLQEEEEEIIWTEITEANEDESILDENFIYPNSTVYEGFNYSGKEFNFIYTRTIGNLTGNYASTIITPDTNPQDYL